MRDLRTIESDEEVEADGEEEEETNFEFSFDDGREKKAVVTAAAPKEQPKSLDSVRELGVSEDAPGRDRRKNKATVARAAHDAADDAVSEYTAL